MRMRLTSPMHKIMYRRHLKMIRSWRFIMERYKNEEYD
jgi:hypothetical protein